MAYGFEQKQAKNNPEVELYLNEGMTFEAWITIIRNWTGDFDELYEQFEKECYKKTTKLTDDEMISLDFEINDYRAKSEEESYIMGGAE